MPKEYAQKFDNAKRHVQVRRTTRSFTGPYMIENDESGKLTGYTPGSVIKLVRNPNWDASTDYKPAYVDSITIKEGNDARGRVAPDPRGRAAWSRATSSCPAPILASVSQGDRRTSWS